MNKINLIFILNNKKIIKLKKFMKKKENNYYLK